MTPITTHNGIQLLIIEVPQDVTWWRVSDTILSPYTKGEFPDQCIQYGYKKGDTKSDGTTEKLGDVTYYNPDNFFLPAGKWEVIGSTNTMTNDMVEKFVGDQMLAPVYLFNNLLSKYGLNPYKNNYLILERI